MPELQIIDETGNQLGKMATFEALRMAQEKGLDLVEVGPQSKPPIAKIMDYGKYMYQKEKQDKRAGKQKDQDVKTVRIGYKTGEHDLKFKSEQIDGFIKDGHPVNVELTLRGREKALASIGREKLENFIKFISEPHTIQQGIKRSPRGWSTTLRAAKK